MPGGSRFVFKSKETLDGPDESAKSLLGFSSVYFAVIMKRLQGEFSYYCFSEPGYRKLFVDSLPFLTLRICFHYLT